MGVLDARGIPVVTCVFTMAFFGKGKAKQGWREMVLLSLLLPPLMLL